MRSLVLNGDNLINANQVGIDKYLVEVSRIPLMDFEEELEVAKLAEKGDAMAKNKLVTSNLRFVISVAKTYNKSSLYLSDLINEGNIGLVEAAELFRTDYGFKFISFAVWHVRKNILRFITDRSKGIRIPSNKGKMLRDIDRVRGRLSQKLEREPSYHELLDEYYEDDTINLKSKLENIDIESIQQTSKGACNIFAGEDDKLGIIDVIGNEDSLPDADVTRESNLELLNEVLNHLSPIEKDIIISRFGLNGDRPRTYAEIGMDYHRTSESIRNWTTKALRKLKRAIKGGYPEIVDLVEST